MEDKDSPLAKFKESIAEKDGKVPGKMSDVRKDREKRAEEKREREEKQRRIEKEAEDEDIKLRGKSKDVVLFQFYVDFISIAIIGLVFFLTCLSGLLNGVSQKMLSIRAIVSVVIASIFVYICRSVITKLFHIKKEKDAGEEDKEEEKEEDEDQDIDG